MEGRVLEEGGVWTAWISRKKQSLVVYLQVGTGGALEVERCLIFFARILHGMGFRKCNCFMFHVNLQIPNCILGSD